MGEDLWIERLRAAAVGLVVGGLVMFLAMVAGAKC